MTIDLGPGHWSCRGCHSVAIPLSQRFCPECAKWVDGHLPVADKVAPVTAYCGGGLDFLKHRMMRLRRIARGRT